MKIAVVIVLFAVIVLGGVWLWRAGGESIGAKQAMEALRSKLGSVSEENNLLKAEAEYFSKPENMEKEIKKRFNYREKDEKMMIIIP